MARNYLLSTWPGWFTDFNSLLVSAVCHLTALIALAFVIAASESKSPGIELAVDLADVSDVPAGDEEFTENAAEIQLDPDDAAAAIGPERVFDETALAATDFGPLQAISEMAANESGQEGAALSDFGDSIGGSGPTGKAATDFFGIGGYGKSFVYVVDCSGSMSESGKFERAVYELLQSIEQLNSEQQYFVLFYNSESYPMDEPGLVLATPKQFEKTRRWISFARPRGGTYPLPALLAALKIKPDAIFFLSDGLFDPRTSVVVRGYNRGKKSRIPIHTIAFVNRETEALMRTIARNSGGKYRFVK